MYWYKKRHKSYNSLLLGWDECNVDVWENTTGSDSCVSHESGKFLVVSNGKLNVSWDNSASLVVSGGITGELKNLSSEVLKHSSKIDWSSSSNSWCVSSLFKISGNSSYWELKSSSCSSGYWSGCGWFSFSSSLSWHFFVILNLSYCQFFSLSYQFLNNWLL